MVLIEYDLRVVYYSLFVCLFLVVWNHSPGVGLQERPPRNCQESP